MKLWLIEPNVGLPNNDNPWDPWYDKAFGFVVRAETEQEARAFAHSEGGDENRNHSPWLDPKYSTATELATHGEAGIVMCTYASA